MASRRYIVKSAMLTLRTPGGSLEQEVWLGFEIEGEVSLEFLSRCGYDMIPCDGFTEDELQSVGVSEFDRIVVPSEAEG